jgi:hypothetical protein
MEIQVVNIYQKRADVIKSSASIHFSVKSYVSME